MFWIIKQLVILSVLVLAVRYTWAEHHQYYEYLQRYAPEAYETLAKYFGSQ